jgi:hypothetical protein
MIYIELYFPISFYAYHTHIFSSNNANSNQNIEILGVDEFGHEMLGAF